MADDTLDVPALQRLLDQLAASYETNAHAMRKFGDLDKQIEDSEVSAAMLRTLASHLPVIVADAEHWRELRRRIVAASSTEEPPARSIPAGTSETDNG